MFIIGILLLMGRHRYTQYTDAGYIYRYPASVYCVYLSLIRIIHCYDFSCVYSGTVINFISSSLSRTTI